MLFQSYQIFILAVIFISLYIASTYLFKSTLIRKIILATTNIVLLLSIMKEHTIIVIAILSMVVYFAGILIRKRKSTLLLAFSLAFLILLFIIRDFEFIQNFLINIKAEFISNPILSVQKIGLSYILFRYVNWLVENHRQSIKKSDPLSFFNYIAFFPAYLAGPIDTYKNFHYRLNKRKLKIYPSMMLAGIYRIFLGSIKTFLLVPLVINYALDYTVFLSDFTPGMAILLNTLAYAAYIYLDFSGYSDIAIGIGFFFEIRLPENFKNPYFSTNISEFWQRWHISFSVFLKKYVFMPFIKLLNSTGLKKYRLLVTVLSYFFTFLICGIWHGNTLNFLIWGAWHGIGLAIFRIYRDLKFVQRIRNSPFYNVFAVLLTFSFVSIGWIFFNYSFENLIEIFKLIFL